MHKKFLNIISVILWLLVIFLLSAIPGKNYPDQAFNYAIAAHILEYFVLAFLLARACGKYSFKKLIFILAFCLLFGISDELHQSQVPFRDTDVIDWGFDVLGVGFGIIGYYFSSMSSLE